MQKYLLLSLTLIIASSNSFAQVCEGNLGVNIFVDGDFGSGAANVLTPDPQIAPGFIYEFNPPPNDGLYTITNNTTNWGAFAINWDNIEDNSIDPNGYMMIVNASFEPGIFYEQQVDGLCENTLYLFSADVYNLINALKPNISFQLDGLSFYESGDVPYNKQWNTYGFTFKTKPGQTSVSLSLRNNAPGGQGNDLALDNISFRPCGPEALILPEDVENICEDGDPINLEATIVGDQYLNPQVQWQLSLDGGITWMNIVGANDLIYTHSNLAAGMYYYRYLLANDPSNLLNTKCRVESNVKLVNVEPKFYTIIDTICEGMSFMFGDNQIFNTGIFEDSLLTVLACDSIVILDLTVIDDPNIEASFELNDPSCSYLNDGSISIQGILNGFEPYLLFVDGEISDVDLDLSNLPAGDYDFLVTDYYGCSLDTSISLYAPIPFTVDLGPDQQIQLGDILQLEPVFSEPVESIQWGDGEVMNCDPDCNNFDFVISESQQLYLTVNSIDGCIAYDSINVIVEKVRNVYIPNVFSPNRDGVNDFFTVYGQEPNIEIIEDLMIYDRWGVLVCNIKSIPPNKPELAWDGTKDAKRLNSGVYTYVASVRFLDGNIVIYSGNITLVE